jgi:hypothetical protein
MMKPNAKYRIIIEARSDKGKMEERATARMHMSDTHPTNIQTLASPPRLEKNKPTS